MSFAGKAVLVTGSTTGIGEACARAFAESGAKVMVSGRSEQRGRAVVDEIQAAGGSAQFTAVDLRAAGACERLVADTVERLGGLDVLVNNAGILYTANALDTSNEQWLDTMAVNVNALF
jgi:NAD(P)-dependent dehydrogenase (short-subunit alcohol dehydrogenase family)